MLKIIQKQLQQQQTSLSKRIKPALSHGIVCILVAAFISCAHTYPVFAASTSHVQNVYGGSTIQEAYDRKEALAPYTTYDINYTNTVIKSILITLILVIIATAIIIIVIKIITKKKTSKINVAILITIIMMIISVINFCKLPIQDHLNPDHWFPSTRIEEINIDNLKLNEKKNLDDCKKEIQLEINRIKTNRCKFMYSSVACITLFILLVCLIIAKIIANLCSSIKTFQRAMGLDDTKILRPAKLGFWLTVIGTPCIIFFYIPIWLPLLIIGYVFTKQAKNMLDADEQPVNDNAYDQADALERLRMRQGQG